MVSSTQRLIERIFPMLRVSTLLAIVVLTAASASPQDAPQEKRKVPKDSIEVTVIGCLKGRVLRTVHRRDVDVESGPYIGERTFRLAGKKDISDKIKQEQNHLVEVTGIVKRSDLDDKGIQAGPLTINGGKPVASTRSLPNPADNVAVMDVDAIRTRATSCYANPSAR
jgi:hypothetical protein